MRTKLLLLVTILAFSLVAGIASIAAQQQATPPPPPPSKFKLMSSAYAEGSMIPTPAIVSMAPIAKSIVNAAVITYVRPPIARVPDV